MQIEVFSICDAATTENGKLNLLGAFDTIAALKTPFIHSQCAVAVRIRFNALEGEKHGVSVKVIDADGKPVIPAAEGTIQIKFPKAQRSCSANLVLNIQGLKLAKYGEYSIELNVDGKSRASAPLFIIERK